MSKHFIIIQKNTNRIVTEHFANQKGTLSEFADENEWVEIEIAMDTPVYYLKVVCNNGKYSLMEDLPKKREYREMRLREKVDAVRNKRNALLQESDWTLGADSPLSDAKKVAWKKYRQQLRDITKLVTSYDQEVAWPTPPV